MQKFTDQGGREWTVKLDVGGVRDVRDNTGVLLTTLCDEGFKLLADLYKDPVLLADIVWLLVQEQATAIHMDVSEFCEGFWGDTVGQARDAVVEATVDFFDDPETRSSVRQQIAKLMKVATEVQQVAINRVKDLDTEQAVKSILDLHTNGPVSAE